MTQAPSRTKPAEGGLDIARRGSLLDHPGAVTVPRPLLWVAIAVLATMPVVILVGGWLTGTAWDETYHVMRMRNFMDSGWYLLDQDLVNGEPGEWVKDDYVYAPFTMTLLHAWSMLWGIEGRGEIADSAHAFAIRHVGVGLIALLGAAAVAATARQLLRSWQWGAVAGAVLLATPMWTGHAMFNIKDIPVGAGYALLTLALVLAAREHGGGWRRGLLVGGIGLAGLLFMLGTRPGMWPGLFASVTAFVVITTAGEWGEGGLVGAVRRNRRRLAEALVPVPIAYGVLAALYPVAFGTPLKLMRESASASGSYGGRSADWWYVPVHALADMPTLLLIAALGGAVVGLRIVWAGRWRFDPRAIGITLVGVQAFTLPLVAMAMESNLYNGLRQLLFVTPALAVLATLGLAAFLARFGAVADGRKRVAALVLACLTVAAPTVDQLRLFPYNYGYGSVPGSIFVPTYESDYWRTSARALAPSIPAGAWVTCSPSIVDGELMRYSFESHHDCGIDTVGPLAAYDDQRPAAPAASPMTFYAVMFHTDQFGSNCEVVDNVTRPGRWGERDLSYLARCDLRPREWEGGPVTYGQPGGNGRPYSLGGWDSHKLVRGDWIKWDRAQLGTTLPDELRGTDLVVRLEIVGTTPFDVEANGEPVDLAPVGDELFEARVPAALADTYGRGRLLLTFADPDAETDVHLLSLDIQEDAR
ncbi:hypothetical protein [Nocardioides speluncae]|uniref:hypothetical protein n=1 Tax=Nocardioides speluncae TaxID=2670337 RepID=UPI000D697DCD|nr:hypothetical protein [Nocardioides speluncae]